MIRNSTPYNRNKRTLLFFKVFKGWHGKPFVEPFFYENYVFTIHQFKLWKTCHHHMWNVGSLGGTQWRLFFADRGRHYIIITTTICWCKWWDKRHELQLNMQKRSPLGQRAPYICNNKPLSTTVIQTRLTIQMKWCPALSSALYYSKKVAAWPPSLYITA